MIFRLSFYLTSKHSKKNPSGSNTDTHQRHPPTTRPVLSLMRTPANDPSGSTTDTHQRHPPTTHRVLSLMRTHDNDPSGNTTDTRQRHPPTTRRVLSLMRTPDNDTSGSTTDTHQRHPPTTRRVLSLMRSPANDPSGSTTDTHHQHPPTTRRVLLWRIMASRRYPRRIYPRSHAAGTRATRPVWRRVSRAKNGFFRQSLPKSHLIISELRNLIGSMFHETMRVKPQKSPIFCPFHGGRK